MFTLGQVRTFHILPNTVPLSLHEVYLLFDAIKSSYISRRSQYRYPFNTSNSKAPQSSLLSTKPSNSNPSFLHSTFCPFLTANVHVYRQFCLSLLRAPLSLANFHCHVMYQTTSCKYPTFQFPEPRPVSAGKH